MLWPLSFTAASSEVCNINLYVEHPFLAVIVNVSEEHNEGLRIINYFKRAAKTVSTASTQACNFNSLTFNVHNWQPCSHGHASKKENPKFAVNSVDSKLIDGYIIAFLSNM